MDPISAVQKPRFNKYKQLHVQMGNTQIKSNVLQQYQILEQIGPVRKILKRKTDNTSCLLVSLPINGQQKYNLIERVKARLTNDKPQFVTPLVSWHRTEQANLCGNKQSIELIFQHTSPTLQRVLQSRRQKNICFNASEILYVVKNIALALKNLQKIQQEYGKVNLSNITISNDVLLMDSLSFEKKGGLEYKKQEIEGYPSPQKLRSLYDSISNFEQLRGDLFSLGMVALQLYFPQLDIKSLYLISDPCYSNYRLDLSKLQQMCKRVSQLRLRQVFALLLSLNSKDRLNIYTFLKTITIDARQIRLFPQTTAHEIYSPIHSMVQKSAIQMVTSQNNTVNISLKRQDCPVTTVQSKLSVQKQGSQIRSINPNINPAPVNFRPPIIQGNPFFQNLSSLQPFSARNQPPILVNTPVSFQPLKFILQESFETSQYINVNNSVQKHIVPSTLPMNQTANRIIFPLSQILVSVQKIKAENQLNTNTQIKQLYFTQIKQLNFAQVKSSASKQEVKHLNKQAENVKRDQLRPTSKQIENFNISMRTESIYQEDTRPLAQQLFKGIITETQLKNQQIPSASKQSLQIEINPIPISNTYEPNQSKTDQQNYQEMSMTPKFSEIHLAQAVEQNITEAVTTSIENKQHQAPKPQDKIQFVIEQYGIGTRYEGGKLHGMRHGRGKFYYKEGSYYDGEWKNNKMHGIGVLYYPNGTIAYEGEWKNDQFDGKGVVYNDQQVKLEGTFDFTDFNNLDEQWVKYEGYLKNDAKQGLGRLYLTNGQIYEGEFLRDTVHGVGVFKSDKGEKRGIWQNGKLKKLI